LDIYDQQGMFSNKCDRVICMNLDHKGGMLLFHLRILEHPFSLVGGTNRSLLHNQISYLRGMEFCCRPNSSDLLGKFSNSLRHLMSNDLMGI
jgi:hypothetical protein